MLHQRRLFDGQLPRHPIIQKYLKHLHEDLRKKLILNSLVFPLLK